MATASLKPYTTKTEPPLIIRPPLKDDEDGQFFVTIEGDRVKELYRGDLASATSRFNEEVAKYEAAQ